ncbi:hypothetical protein GCM10009735_75740 [Actinomadura chokoriensis]
MQAHGLYFLVEMDATGQNRLLLWDRNWVVVRQTPAAGKLVDSEVNIAEQNSSPEVTLRPFRPSCGGGAGGRGNFAGAAPG